MAARPSFENLRCFLAAADQLNFRRAAASVALTPAAFSQRIKQLESELGVQLFDRSGRRISLTTDGQALRPKAEKAVDALTRCSNPELRAAEFTVGTRFELGLSWLVPAIIDLGPTPQEWAIDLVFGNGDEILDKLDRGAVDAVITSSPVVREDWSAEVLHPERYVLVGSPELLARLPLSETTDTAQHQLLDINASLPLGRYLISACSGVSFASTRCCGTGAAVHALAVAGHGVAVLPVYMVAEQIAAGTLVALLPDVELLRDSFRLMFRDVSPMRSALEAFAEYLRSRPLT